VTVTGCACAPNEPEGGFRQICVERRVYNETTHFKVLGSACVVCGAWWISQLRARSGSCTYSDRYTVRPRAKWAWGWFSTCGCRQKHFDVFGLSKVLKKCGQVCENMYDKLHGAKSSSSCVVWRAQTAVTRTYTRQRKITLQMWLFFTINNTNIDFSFRNINYKVGGVCVMI
jgi:hypothetical protein